MTNPAVFAIVAVVTAVVSVTVGCASSSGREVAASSQPVAASPAPAPATARFPDDWLGRWTGPAQQIQPDGRVMDFRVELDFHRTDDPTRFMWKLVYAGEMGRQVRNYEFVVIDEATGRYAIDEKSSIVIPMCKVGEVLYSAFSIEDVTIVGHDRLINFGRPDEHWLAELVTFPASDTESSGGERNMPKVGGRRPSNVQRAILRR
ncbi:MAG: hypothetical protein ACKVS9_01625 [Phycisphaerae bacterium]